MTQVLEDNLRLEEIESTEFEKIIVATDSSVSLKAIICIHNTMLGVTLGGVRIYPYQDFSAALTDAKRLATGMTYKSALAKTELGGGKSVIIADPKKDVTPELLQSFAKAVDSLKGQYICAEDMGCTPETMREIAKTTPYVVGLPHEKSSGNPSPFTAWGTFRGIQACMQQLHNNSSVEGKKIAIQGLGSVGMCLAEILFWHGAKLIVSDLDINKMKECQLRFSAEAVLSQEIMHVSCDVFAPCAMGGTLNKETIPHLLAQAVAGCANNQLLTEQDGNLLRDRGILYAPDFVINAGGLINVTEELESDGYNPARARNKAHQIYEQLLVIFEIAKQNNYSTNQAAIELGNYRLKYGIGKRKNPIYLHHAGVVY